MAAAGLAQAMQALRPDAVAADAADLPDTLARLVAAG